MSAAEVSAASARKAAGIEKGISGMNRSSKGKEKERERERDKNNNEGKNGDKNGDKANGKDKGKDKDTWTSISKSKPPILTITPAPSTSTSATYPSTRSRTALATASAVLEVTPTSISEIAASESSPAASTAAASNSPLISPLPSPLLSPPHSPQSTYSSAPTSASAASTGLLSPSFTSTSTSTSASFSPASSELLSPYSMHSLNSPCSMPSPHSPAVSTSSDKEPEIHTPEFPAQVSSDRELERSLKSLGSISKVVTAPSRNSCSLLARRPLSPAVSRSPSPLSPQFGTQALFPVSNARGSISSLKNTDTTTHSSRHNTLPLPSMAQKGKDDHLSIHRQTSPLPRRALSPAQRNEARLGTGSPPCRTSPNRTATRSPSLETSSRSRPPMLTGRGKEKETGIGSTEKCVDKGYWPPLPEKRKAFHKAVGDDTNSDLASMLHHRSPPPISALTSKSVTLATDNGASQSSFQSRPALLAHGGEESRQERGFWPTELPSQKRKFHFNPLLIEDAVEDEDNFENDSSGEEGERGMTEAVGGKKKGRLPTSRMSGLVGLKPGFGKEIERQTRSEANEKMDDIQLNKSRITGPEIQSYMDVDSSECASLSGPPNDISVGFTIRPGLGRLRSFE